MPGSGNHSTGQINIAIGIVVVVVLLFVAYEAVAPVFGLPTFN